MAPFEVTDAAHIKAILQAFACLDDIRWSNPPKRTLVNYCSDDLTADEKLLTHWVTYITDRQMRFMRVWEIGGYVFSHLVRAFERSDRDVRSLVREYVRKKETGASNIAFQCPREGQNRRLELARMTEDPVQFASRYVPEDAFRVFRTLALLERTSDRRLGRFLSFFVSEDIPLAQSVRRLAVALDGLTYSAGARVTADQLEQELEQLPASVSYEAEEIRASPSAWLKSKERSFQPWGKKRLWCSLRDYLKGAEFNRHFVDALTGAGVATARRWRLENQELRVALDQLELPGDVWNNNKIFADGLFMPYLKNRPKAWGMPKTVREVYQRLETELRGEFYPEQLDVTFDFVPRMCERQVCHLCLFGGGVARLCHRQPGLLCPVPLTACGYEHQCQPSLCAFKTDDLKGICRHWQSLVTEARS